MDGEDERCGVVALLARASELHAAGLDEATEDAPRFDPAAVRLPLVSVIVTAHNYADYVGECLASIRAQSYGKFECIVVDDASSDGTPDVVAALLRTWRDDRFSLVSSVRNLGQLGAQMLGFARSRGEFISFVDADDLLHADFLERHLFAHLNVETPVAFTSSDQWTIDGAGTVLSFHHSDVISRLLSGEGQDVLIGAGSRKPMPAIMFHWRHTHFAFGEWWWATQSTMMFRRPVLQMIMPDQIAPGVFRICSDHYLVRFAQLLGGSMVLREALGRYRRHGGNNFSANPLIAGRMQTGDMRIHPTDGEFHALALETLAERRDRFMAVLGNPRFAQLAALFHKGRPARHIVGIPIPRWLHRSKLHRLARLCMIRCVGEAGFAWLRLRLVRH